MIKVAKQQAPSPAIPNPIDYDAFLAKLGARDRLNVERHITACEAENTLEHAKLWKRVACSLGTLAPHTVVTVGQQAVQFFTADGKYRRQTFAMEDQRDGKILIYLEDVMKRAMRKGILSAPAQSDPESHAHPIKGAPGESLLVESLDAANTPNPSNWYKHMLGWNRKALRITLLVTATPPQIDALERMCLLAIDTKG